MDAARALELVESFQRRRLAVVGDFYLDEYVYGYVLGVSPEMPVLRLVEEERISTPGAAGNVAVNLASLGARVSAFGIAGADQQADLLAAGLTKHGVDIRHMQTDPARATGTLTRFLARGPDGAVHHQLRVDRDTPTPVPDAVRRALAGRLREFLAGGDGVFFADYDETRGDGRLTTRRLIEEIACASIEHRVWTAGSSRRHAADLSGVDYLICNETEGRSLGLASRDRLSAWARGVRRHLRVGTICVTLGKDGVFCQSDEDEVSLAMAADRVADTCGAGDTFAATFVLARLGGGALREAAQLGVRAAAIVVGKPGTEPITASELAYAIKYQGRGGAKLLANDALAKALDELRSSKRIVFTNGYFDLFHAGHVQLLRRARQCGDILVVGINSDRSTRANKGEGRPVLAELERIEILTALEFVDYVTVFDELTPINLIRQLKPAVLVKGGNYTPDEVVGKDIIEALGGEVRVIPYEGRLTTASLIGSIKAASDGMRSP